MTLGIDHLVVAVDDPDGAAAELETKLGLDAGGGGRHDALGTFNRLVWFGDSYLELVGVFDRGLAEASWLGGPVLAALERGGGLATWAVAVDDLAAHLRWAPESAGLVGPLDGERRRPDGRLVRWRLAHPPELSAASPFLIEHDTSAAEWTPDERLTRASEAHPIGGRVRLLSLEIEAPAPAPAAGRLRSMLGTSVEPAGRAGVGVHVGRHVVRFLASRPRGPTGVELVAEVTMRRRSIVIGDCEIRVRGLPPKPAAVAAADEAPRPEPA
ncbi:MAG TPA: VOC family protein [Candidatus Limnocylindrales bacterium]|nr:VOC family protein [Candidatus Limnocylindrales bacterium]